MSAHWTPTSVVLLLAGPIGCVDDDGDSVLLPEAELAAFRDDVQPVLSEDCSKENCHGRLGRPLGLYAVGAVRLDPEDADSDIQLTDAEIEANLLRARGFLVDITEPETSLLLTKPLPVSDGGTVHEPGAVFDSPVDHRYVAIFDWVELALTSEESP